MLCTQFIIQFVLIRGMFVPEKIMVFCTIFSVESLIMRHIFHGWCVKRVTHTAFLRFFLCLSWKESLLYFAAMPVSRFLLEGQNLGLYVVLLEQHFYSSRFASCSRLIHLPRKATCQIKSTQSENKLPLFLLCSFFELLLCFEPHCIAAESSV